MNTRFLWLIGVAVPLLYGTANAQGHYISSAEVYDYQGSKGWLVKTPEAMEKIFRLTFKAGVWPGSISVSTVYRRTTDNQVLYHLVKSWDKAPSPPDKGDFKSDEKDFVYWISAPGWTPAGAPQIEATQGRYVNLKFTHPTLGEFWVHVDAPY